MVAYITRDDSPEIPPPYEFTDITILSFRLMAKLSNLQDLCDQWLNVGTLAKRGFKYKACFPFVDMEIVNYPPHGVCGAALSRLGICYAARTLLSFLCLEIPIRMRVVASSADARAIFPLYVRRQFLVDAERA